MKICLLSPLSNSFLENSKDNFLIKQGLNICSHACLHVRSMYEKTLDHTHKKNTHANFEIPLISKIVVLLLY